MAAEDDDRTKIYFDIKPINWSEYNFETPILLQDKNGPCPLIALVNTLVLSYDIQNKRLIFNEARYDLDRQRKLEAVGRFKLFLESKRSVGGVSLDSLLTEIGELLLVFSKDSNRHDLDELLENLPGLHTGLTVDPNLVSGSFNKETLSFRLFEIFDLQLKHGWCVNRIENESHDFVSSTEGDRDNYGTLVELIEELQTFDKIQDYLFINVDETAASTDGKVSILQNQRLIRSWLNSNRTQLTNIGLQKLNMSMAKEELVVFFRNNHFNTLLKRDDSEFYLLITDNVFKDKGVVWQSLISVSGNEDLFFDGEFLPVFNDTDHVEPSHDYLLTKQLQEEEDANYAKKMQSRYEKRVTASQTASEGANKKDKKDKSTSQPGEKKKRWFSFSRNK